MTDKAKLEQLFEAALQDNTDFTGKMPRPIGWMPRAASRVPRTAHTIQTTSAPAYRPQEVTSHTPFLFERKPASRELY